MRERIEWPPSSCKTLLVVAGGVTYIALNHYHFVAHSPPEERTACGAAAFGWGALSAASIGVLSTARAKAVTSPTPSPHSKTQARKGAIPILAGVAWGIVRRVGLASRFARRRRIGRSRVAKK